MDPLLLHIVNFCLVAIGVLAVRSVFISPVIIFIIIGLLCLGYSVSFLRKSLKLPYFDILLNILSISVVIWFVGNLFLAGKAAWDLDTLIRAFVKVSLGLLVIHSFSLLSRKDYIFNLALSIPLVISSAVLGLEREHLYLIYIIVYVFLWTLFLRSVFLEEKAGRAFSIIDISTRPRRSLGLFNSSVAVFLLLSLLAWTLFLHIPKVKVSPSGIIASIMGLKKGDRPEGKSMQPQPYRPSTKENLEIGVEKGKAQAPLIGKSPGPGLRKDILNRQRSKERFNYEGRLTYYREKGTVDEKKYDMARFDIKYDSKGRVQSYKEIGIQENTPYELQRDNISYDEQGKLTGFHEKGVLGGQEYEFKKDFRSERIEEAKQKSEEKLSSLAPLPNIRLAPGAVRRSNQSYDSPGEAGLL
jgi:hypothetical protein